MKNRLAQPETGTTTNYFGVQKHLFVFPILSHRNRDEYTQDSRLNKITNFSALRAFLSEAF